MHEIPYGDEHTIAAAETPTEELRSVYHAINWQKELGGAGITPGFGKWKNVASAFPLHMQGANADLLRKWSKTTTLSAADLDAIRAIFGEKVSLPYGSIKSKHADPPGRLLFCLYPLLLLLSRLSRHLGHLLLVLLRPLLHHLCRRQLPLVPGFCRILEDPRNRFEPTMERQGGRGAES